MLMMSLFSMSLRAMAILLEPSREIWFPVPAATFNRLSNFTSQFIRSGLGVT
jgi:hypothetical protein